MHASTSGTIYRETQGLACSVLLESERELNLQGARERAPPTNYRGARANALEREETLGAKFRELRGPFAIRSPDIYAVPFSGTRLYSAPAIDAAFVCFSYSALSKLLQTLHSFLFISSTYELTNSYIRSGICRLINN